MRIGIDARLWQQTGVGRYIRNLTSELAQLDKENEFYIYLRKSEYETFSPPSPKWQKRLLDVTWHTFVEQVRVPIQLYKDNLDVMHFPYFNVPVFYRGSFLLTVHDLIVDHFDTGRASTKSLWFYKLKRMGYKLATKSAVRRAAKIAVISETTKSEVVNHYHIPENEIVVTHDGLDGNFRQVAGKYKSYKYYKFPYILYVGNAYPHKNLERLITAMKIIKGNNVKLILVGNDDYFFTRLKNLVSSEQLTNEVIFFGEANDEQLVNLYTYAKCLVFPSLMEGFGLPNLEAVYCNCLPVVSDIPVFKEIWGDNLIYFDPNNVNDIARKLLMAIKMDTTRYKKMIEKLKPIVDSFNWKKTAEQTLQLYEEIYKSG